MSNFPKDFVGSFLGGIDSGVDPHLLPKNKLAWATNASVRGGFISPRPKFIIQKITGSNPSLAALSGLFQGAAFYAPGPTSKLTGDALFASISGRLFAFTPDNFGNCSMQEFTTAAPNSATAPQAWLGQAENYLIVQDGTTPNPMIFDGNTSFRSVSAITTVGTFTSTTSANIPPIGSTIQVSAGTDLVAAIPPGYYNLPLGLYAPTSVAAASGLAPNQYLGQLTLTVIPSTGDQFGATLQSATTQTVNYGDVIYSQSSTFPSTTQTTSLTTIGLPQPYTSPYGVNTADAYNAANTANYIANSLVALVTVAEYKVAVGSPYGSPPVPTGRSQVITTPSITSTMIGAGNFTIPTPADPYGSGSKITAITLQYKVQSGAPVFSYTPIGTIAASHAGISYLITPGTPVPIVLAGNAAYPSSSAQNAPVFIGPNSASPGSNGQYTIASFTASGTVSYYLTNQTVTATAVGLKGCTLTTLAGIPCGTAWAYSQGRMWTALPNGTSFVAGDIVGGSSGTLANQFKDAILYTMENTLLANGGTFSTPGNSGQIRALKPAPTLDVSLGQGPLQVFTTQCVFSCNAPTDITTWASVTSPIVTQSLLGAGATSQDGTVQTNGDILFRSTDGIRSLTLARLDFYKWPNTPISREVRRVIDSDDPTLLQYATSCLFDNRILFGANPVANSNGVVFQQTVVINLDTISNLQEKSPSVWDGVWTNISVLKYVTGLFGNRTRCFAFVSDGTHIGLIEILPSASGQDIAATPGQTTWSFETNVFFNQNDQAGEWNLMRLEDGEMYVTNILGKIFIQVDFRHDYDTQWRPWYGFFVDNTTGDVPYKNRMGLGPPTGDLGSTDGLQNRDGYDFQIRVTITGSCQFMGMKIKVSVVPQAEFAPPIAAVNFPVPPPPAQILRSIFAGFGAPLNQRPGGNGGIYYDASTGTVYPWYPLLSAWDAVIVSTGATSISVGVSAFAGSGPPTTQTPANSAGSYYDYTGKATYWWNPNGYWDGTTTGGNGIIVNSAGEDYLGGSGAPTTQKPANGAGIYFDYLNAVMYNWNPTTNSWE